MTKAQALADAAVRLAPALLGVGLFVLVGLASVAALWRQADVTQWAGYLAQPYLWRLVRFSLWQALLSSGVSLLLAVAVASCLCHRNFWGKQALLQGFALSMVVPTLVAVLGIVVVYGRSGWLNQWFGLELPLYGLLGIVLAHVFFNMPLAVRLLLQGYALIPGGQWRLASQLGFGRWAAFWLIEWPYVRRVLPGAFVLVFMLCFSSFAVVLSLGGGPRSSTLEVAIYQALRFDFDIGRATFLSLLQMLICGVMAALVYRLSTPPPLDVSLWPRRVPGLRDSGWARTLDGAALTLALLWVVPPFLAILGPVGSPTFMATLWAPATWRAVGVSLSLAVPAALLSVALGLAFAVGARAAMERPGWAWLPQQLEQLGNWILVMPALVLATGLFLLLRDAGWSAVPNHAIVVWVNAVMALPFVLRALLPAVYQYEKRYRRLYQSLGVRGWTRVLRDWPLLRRSVAQALGYAMLLSLGDMGVIAFFCSQGLVSLPLYLYQLIGTDRLQEGASVAVLLVLLCALLFMACTRGIGGPAPKVGVGHA